MLSRPHLRHLGTRAGVADMVATTAAGATRWEELKLKSLKLEGVETNIHGRDEGDVVMGQTISGDGNMALSTGTLKKYPSIDIHIHFISLLNFLRNATCTKGQIIGVKASSYCNIDMNYIFNWIMSRGGLQP